MFDETEVVYLPFVLNYSKRLPNKHHILKKRQQILENADCLKPQNTPLVTLRRNKNLTDLRVYKKLITLLNFSLRKKLYVSRGVQKMSKQIIRFSQFQDYNGKTYHVNNLLICKTSNIFFV